MIVKRLIILVFIAALCACSDEPEATSAERVNSIASDFVGGYYSQYPEEAYESAYPDAPMDRFGNHSESHLVAWDKQVDNWLEEVVALDPTPLSGTVDAVTYLFARERLEAIIGMRVCRMELWNVSPTWTGWPSMITSTLGVQPVSTAVEREAALARSSDIARYLDTEISNLRRGVGAGYLAPQTNVDAVVEQVTALIDTPVDESPFLDPAIRSKDSKFAKQYRETVEKSVIPALIRYRDFLAIKYSGRDVIGVSANPDGEACYAASVRYWSSLPMDPGDIHRAGLSNMSRIQSEMLAIARESFGTDDLKSLLQELRTKPEYTFESEQAMLDYIDSAVGRAKAAMPDWFAYVPESRLIITPSPAFEKDSGGGFYSAGSADGSIGIYKVGTYNPTGISKAGTESTAFHESWPGHHLDSSIALGNQALHPILRYMWSSGTSEGWALYSERLADEIGLYSSELARLGMLSNEAFRAARLVVDPGMHVMGWTRQNAIDYMLENTAEGFDAVAGEVDRYAAVPGQATSYLVGSLEIQRLRQKAERMLGDKFDIRVFHNRILENGSVTLPMLGMSIDAWIEETLAR
ncbi:MAG: DUF885 domain-containing protein [Gammaproteobacteria bacterium]|nr:DUF885 domain-containing protein [Gammaproteobacteria bacterium]